MQNILFEYLYRDAANYKNHGFVIFSNKNHLTLEQIESDLRAKMIDTQWFYANKWQVPDLHFEKWDSETDHDYHEFSFIAYSQDNATDARDISELLSLPA